MEQRVTIEVVKGPDQGSAFQVPGAGFTIGRTAGRDSVDCELARDLSVSRRHAVGRVKGDRIELEDWPGHPSKAGLLVRGKRLPSVSLRHGDVVTVGRTVLAFRLPGTERRLRVKLTPVLKRWLGLGTLLALMAAGTAVWRVLPGRTSRDTQAQEWERAWTARNSGNLEHAIQAACDSLKAKGDSAEMLALERDCRRYARLFEEPRRLEESLRLDEARDAWATVAMRMPAGDPLRQWVETGCIARVSRQLAALRP